MKRREFTRLLGLGAAAAAFGGCGSSHSEDGEEPQVAALTTTERTLLISMGNDLPTEYLPANIRSMEEVHFDGCVIAPRYYFPPLDARVVAHWYQWLPREIPWEALAISLGEIRATEFHRFTENFLRLTVTPGTVDWFSPEMAVVIQNYATLARFAKAGGCVGFFFDNEPYAEQLFSYPHRDLRFSFAEYEARVESAAGEIMSALLAEFPTAKIIIPLGYDQARATPAPPEANRYGLLPAFLNGLYENATTESTLIFASEASYSWTQEIHFDRVRPQFEADHAHLSPVARSAIEYGWSTWLDYNSSRLGFSTTNLTQNSRPPEVFKRNVELILQKSDRYAWVYNELPRWWRENPPENPKMPKEYVRVVNEVMAGSL